MPDDTTQQVAQQPPKQADTPEQAVAKVSAEVYSEVSSNERAVISEIQGTIMHLQGKGEKAFEDMSADELSQLAARLAILSVNLGEIISRSQRNWRVSIETTKFRKARLREIAEEELRANFPTKKRFTLDDIDAYITSHAFRSVIKDHLYEEHFSKLQHLWWSLKNILSALDHRIVFTQSAMRMQSYDRLGHVEDLPSLATIAQEQEQEQKD